MKKIFQIILVYALGIVCVYTLAWRVNKVDSYNNNSLICSASTDCEVYNN